MLTKKSKIFVAGHKGMVGSAILRLLKNEKYTNLITVDKKQLNLLDQKKVFSFLSLFKLFSEQRDFIHLFFSNSLTQVVCFG